MTKRKKLSKKAIDILRQVKAHILEEPRRFNMAVWRDRIDRLQQHPPCGTTACIGGWIVILYEPGRCSVGDYSTKACRLLGITLKQGLRLFLTLFWPTKFRERYLGAYSCKDKAKVAAERIDYFIRYEK